MTDFLPFHIFQLVKTLPFHMGPPAPTQSGSLIYLKPEKKKRISFLPGVPLPDYHLF